MDAVVAWDKAVVHRRGALETGVPNCVCGWKVSGMHCRKAGLWRIDFMVESCMRDGGEVQRSLGMCSSDGDSEMVW